MDAILPLGDVVLMEACRFKFEMSEGWLPEHWGIETSVISRRRNALLPVWESELCFLVYLFHYKDRSILFPDLCSKD